MIDENTWVLFLDIADEKQPLVRAETTRPRPAHGGDGGILTAAARDRPNLVRAIRNTEQRLGLDPRDLVDRWGTALDPETGLPAPTSTPAPEADDTEGDS